MSIYCIKHNTSYDVYNTSLYHSILKALSPEQTSDVEGVPVL